MALNEDVTILIDALTELIHEENFFVIAEKIDQRYDASIRQILTNWMTGVAIYDNEKKFLDRYSSLQLSFVEHFYLNYNQVDDNADLIRILRKSLFRNKQIEILKDVVIFIREEQQQNRFNIENDVIFVFLMRMLDSRTLAYRLCWTGLSPPPNDLIEEFLLCFNHRDTKSYLYQIKEYDTNSDRNSIDKLINYRHQFFIGCCTFAIATYQSNHRLLSDERQTKLIYLSAKYLRVIMNTDNFIKKNSYLYCLRGILTLLTNGLKTDEWINTINHALSHLQDIDAQRINPFNQDLFTLLIMRLFGSEFLQTRAIESVSCLETTLIDIAFVFLNKWSDTLIDQNDNDENDNNQQTISSNRQNQVHLLLSSTLVRQNVKIVPSQVLSPYINAKYDRIRLMALATLSEIMNFQDFQALQSKHSRLGEDLVKLLFDFVERALTNPMRQYKGISFERLLRYLFRFLNQDSIKKHTIGYISTLVALARQHHFYALKILRRISSSPAMKNALLQNEQLVSLINHDAVILFDTNPKMKSLIVQIRESLFPEQNSVEESISVNDETRQAFISYTREDEAQCTLFVEEIRELNVFSSIWVDHENMTDDLIASVTKAIQKSKVVFVLLSDAYCSSDFCRRQWTFAAKKNITIYPLIIDEKFKIENYDWVMFNIGDRSYYKIYDNKDLQRLMDQLRKLSLSRPVPQIKPPDLELSESIRSSKSATVLKNRIKNYEKKNIHNWTSHDIQEWCDDKKLEKWKPLLMNHNGSSLVQLGQMVANDSNIQYFINRNGIDVFDIAHFRSELTKAQIEVRRVSSVSTIPDHRRIANRSIYRN